VAKGVLEGGKSEGPSARRGFLSRILRSCKERGNGREIRRRANRGRGEMCVRGRYFLLLDLTLGSLNGPRGDGRREGHPGEQEGRDEE